MQRAIQGLLATGLAFGILVPVAPVAKASANLAVPIDVITSGTIQPADTLWNISRVQSVPLDSLQTSNPQLDAQNLKIGQSYIVPRVWRVQKGDTLFLIAHWFGVSVQSIASLNQIVNPDVILTGTTLLVPQRTANNQVSIYRDWIVSSGDTLWSIANTTGTSYTQLALLNGIAESNQLKIGRRLIVPPSAVSWVQTRTTPPNNNAQPSGSTPVTSQTIHMALSSPIPVSHDNALPMYSMWTYQINVTVWDANQHPVSGVQLAVYGNPWANADILVTDLQGQATFTLSVPKSDTNTQIVYIKDPETNVTSSISIPPYVS